MNGEEIVSEKLWGAIRNLGIRRPNHRDRSWVSQLSALHGPHREEMIPFLSVSPQKPDSQGV